MLGNSMTKGYAITRPALRVLATITAGGQPDPTDVEQLRKAAPDSLLPIEKLALGIIQRHRNAPNARRLRAAGHSC